MELPGRNWRLLNILIEIMNNRLIIVLLAIITPLSLGTILSGCSQAPSGPSAEVTVFVGDPPQLMTDEFSLIAEGEVLRSHAVLAPVVKALGLEGRWSISQLDAVRRLADDLTVTRGQTAGSLIIWSKLSDQELRTHVLDEVCKAASSFKHWEATDATPPEDYHVPKGPAAKDWRMPKDKKSNEIRITIKRLARQKDKSNQ